MAEKSDAERLHVTLPYEPDGLDPKTYISRVVNENIDEFRELFGRMIDHEDARTELLDDTISVRHVDLSGKKGMVEIEFSTELWSGCKDLRSSDDHDVTIEFRIVGRKLRFDIKQPPAWRAEDRDD